MKININASALKIAGLYAVFSLSWIFFSDQILFSLVQDAQLLTTIQSIKGWLFVTVTSALIFVLLKREITRIYLIQKEMAHTKNLLEEIIEAMPSTIISFNEDNEVVHWNRKATEMTQCDKNDAKGKSLNRVDSMLPFPIDEKLIVENSKPQHKNRVKFQRNGHVHYVNVSTYPIIQDQGTLTILRIDDVTESVQMEELSIQSEKLASIGGMAAGMAHEINNPLAIIVQGAQNIQRRLTHDQEANIKAAERHGIDMDGIKSYIEERKINDFLTGIIHGGDRAATIVKNMLKLSRNTTSEKILFSVVNVIESAIELGASDYDMQNRFDFKFVEIKREYDDSIPEILCCPNELQQVFINLFKNAIQAMENIEEEGFKPQFQIQIVVERDLIKIVIKDNGPGMPATVKNKIFEPFYTTKSVGSGTGLGLSVSHSIITQHHSGTFEVESEVGKGTAFTIRLPILTP